MARLHRPGHRSRRGPHHHILLRTRRPADPAAASPAPHALRRRRHAARAARLRVVVAAVNRDPAADAHGRCQHGKVSFGGARPAHRGDPLRKEQVCDCVWILPPQRGHGGCAQCSFNAWEAARTSDGHRGCCLRPRRARAGLPPPASPGPAGRLTFTSDAATETTPAAHHHAAQAGGPASVAEVALRASADVASSSDTTQPERLEARLAAVEAVLNASLGSLGSGGSAPQQPSQQQQLQQQQVAEISLEMRLAAIEARQEALHMQQQAQHLQNVSFGSPGFPSPSRNRWQPEAPSSIDGVDGESRDPLPPRSESPWGGSASPDAHGRRRPARSDATASPAHRRVRLSHASERAPSPVLEQLGSAGEQGNANGNGSGSARGGSRVQEEMLVGMLHAAAEGAAAQIAAAKMEAAAHLAAAAAAEAALKARATARERRLLSRPTPDLPVPSHRIRSSTL